ncbi:MAG TPA: winged helix-turn-helix transcriptional regulator [Flavipsychrobacter sp.]|jgi:DNA-binding HxlR family transcriptional regulator|nr:winged helix-turn-helix transcriptional regulator [Flavipsychrobacter sp.]
MAKPVVPPYVNYELSKAGQDLRPTLYAMAVWAVNNGGKLAEQFTPQLTDFPGGD